MSKSDRVIGTEINELKASKIHLPDGSVKVGKVTGGEFDKYDRELEGWAGIITKQMDDMTLNRPFSVTVKNFEAAKCYQDMAMKHLSVGVWVTVHHTDRGYVVTTNLWPCGTEGACL